MIWNNINIAREQLRKQFNGKMLGKIKTIGGDESTG